MALHHGILGAGGQRVVSGHQRCSLTLNLQRQLGSSLREGSLHQSKTARVRQCFCEARTGAQPAPLSQPPGREIEHQFQKWSQDAPRPHPHPEVGEEAFRTNPRGCRPEGSQEETTSLPADPLGLHPPPPGTAGSWCQHSQHRAPQPLAPDCRPSSALGLERQEPPLPEMLSRPLPISSAKGRGQGRDTNEGRAPPCNPNKAAAPQRPDLHPQ